MSEAFSILIGMSATLLTARLGETVTLDVPGCDPALRRRLAEIGVRCGQCVCPLQRIPGGGRVVSVGPTRIALDKVTCALLPLRVDDPAAA